MTNRHPTAQLNTQLTMYKYMPDEISDDDFGATQVESYNYPHHYHYQSNHHHHITQNPTTPNNHHNQHYNSNNLSSFNLNFHQQLPYNTYIDADADFTLKKVYEHPSSLVQEIPKKFTTFHGYKPQYDNNQSSNQQPINHQEQKRAKHCNSKIHQPSQNSRQPPPPVPVPVPVRSVPNVPDPKISSIPQTHGCQYQNQHQDQPQQHYLKDPRAGTKISTGTTQHDLILQELREKIPKKPKSIRINKPAIKPTIHFDDQVHWNDDDDDNDDKDHHHHPSSNIFESIHSTYNNHYHDNYGYDSHEHENDHNHHHHQHHNHPHPHHHKDQSTNPPPKNKITFKNNKQLHYAATYSSSSQLQKKLVQLPRAELCPSISRSTRAAGKSTVATATTLFTARNNGNGKGNGDGNSAEGARANPNRKSELTPLSAHQTHKPLQYIFGFEPQVILLEKVKNDNNKIISRSKSKSKTVTTAASTTSTTTLTKMAPTIPNLKNQNPAKGTSSSQQLQQNNPVTLNPMSLQSQSISLAKEGKDNNLISIHTTTNHHQHPAQNKSIINNNSNNNNTGGKNNGGDYNNYKIHKHTIRVKNMPVGPINGSETTNNYFNQSNNSNSHKHVSTISSNIFNNDRVTLTINAATPTMPNPSDHLININSSSSSSSSNSNNSSNSASSDNNITNIGNGSGSVRVISTTNSRNNHHHQHSNGPNNRQNQENIFVADSDNQHNHHTQNHKNITRCSLGPATGSSQIEITNSNHNHTKSNKKPASSSSSNNRNHRRGSTTVTDLTHIVNDSDTNDSDDHGLNFPVNITNNTEMIPTSHQHHNHNHNHHTHNHNQSDSTSSTSVSGGSTTSSTTKMISTADVFANSISYPGSKPNPYCPSCHGVVPLDHLEPSLDLPPAKSEHGGFWNQQHNHNFRHTTLHRESSFHSYGGFTLNGQPGHITANKHKVRRFCSSHKVAFVVSTFSMIVTIGLIITLLLMKKKGMMEAM